MLRYGPEPYAYRKMYGRSRIRYGRHPYWHPLPSANTQSESLILCNQVEPSLGSSRESLHLAAAFSQPCHQSMDRCGDREIPPARAVHLSSWTHRLRPTALRNQRRTGPVHPASAPSCYTQQLLSQVRSTTLGYFMRAHVHCPSHCVRAHGAAQPLG